MTASDSTDHARGPGPHHRRRSGTGIAVLVALACTLAACSSGSSSPSSTSPPASRTLRVLVTNDDGVGAPGINTAVQALRALPHTQVTVVAPATNQSGTGGKTTSGTLTASAATTASGYPAKAVHGYPADTIVWAVKDKGISFRPDLVVSGINFGQNIGPFADESGTVGAARLAIGEGIPALAVSQGVDNGAGPNFSQAATQMVAWITAHRASLLAGPKKAAGASGNLNVPTCANGRIRGPVHASQATSFNGVNIANVDCTSTSAPPATDVEAFVEGFAVISPLAAPSSGAYPAPTS